MKRENLDRAHRIRVTGVCIVELQSGEILTVQNIRNVPDSVRIAGAKWPDDVKVKNPHDENL